VRGEKKKMTKEEEISGRILAQFPFLDGKTRVQRARRIWVETPGDKFDGVLNWLVDKEAFNNLCTITGQDEGEVFSITYHLARKDGIVLNLKVMVARQKPEWKSVASWFPGCVNYEREIAGLFGVQFANLPPGPRYPLPDDWPEGEYPLRKDWKQENPDGENK
jgi:Ni,Fe-hydrogenase III component G